MNPFAITRITILALFALLIIFRIIFRIKAPYAKQQIKAFNILILAAAAALSTEIIIEKNSISTLLIPVIPAVFILIPLLSFSRFKVFRKNCIECGAKRKITEIIAADSQKCLNCLDKELTLAPTNSKLPQKLTYTSPFVDQIDWDSWEPNMKAVLGFVIQNEKVLLIHKKTGLGQGKINAPGGKIEPGETPEEAVIRELEEELYIKIKNPVKKAELHFQFTDGLALHTICFIASEFDGTPGESPEAIPVWSKIEEIPYEKMWEDDRYWLPSFLSGKKINGWFTFDGDKMLDMKVEENY